MAAIRGKDTAPEMIVRRLVHAMGFRYRLHVAGVARQARAALRKRGWRVLTVWDCQIKQLSRLEDRLIRFLTCS